MLTIFTSMFLFSLIGAISPGPVNIIATCAGAQFGFKKALPHVIGATASYTLIVFIAGIALAQVTHIIPQITMWFKFIGGSFLLYMAYKIATTTPTSKTSSHNKLPPKYAEGALSQLLNPKAWLVSLSGVSLFVSGNTPEMLYLMIFCLISFTVCFIGISTWAALGHIIQDFLSSTKKQVVFNIIMALLLASSVFSLFIES